MKGNKTKDRLYLEFILRWSETLRKPWCLGGNVLCKRAVCFQMVLYSHQKHLRPFLFLVTYCQE